MTARRNPLLTELRQGGRRVWRRARKKRPGRGPLVRHHPPNQGGVTATGAVPGFTSGEVVDPPSKKVLVRAIREAKPHNLITQDPDRYYAMLLILEVVALAARGYAVEELGGFAPPRAHAVRHDPAPPELRRGDVADVWDLKEAAMDQLESQLTFSGQTFPL